MDESGSYRGDFVFAESATANTSSCLDSNVLLLNAHYAALRVVSVRRAFTLLFKRDDCFRPVAEVITLEEGQYVSYDFDDWAELSIFSGESWSNGHDWVRTVRFNLLVPRIVRVLTFSRMPRPAVKFNRRTLLARDDNMCQYCFKRFPAAELTLDHVMPRSRGGSTTWGNVVCACHRCNVRKGGRTPEEAGIRLARAPVKPRSNPVVNVKLRDRRYAVWRPFLDRADGDDQSTSLAI